MTVESGSDELAARQLRGILDQVTRIWKPYGVDVCARPVLAPACPASDILVRVIVGDRRPRPQAETIGWIQFLSTGVPHNVVYASLEGVRLALERGRIGSRFLRSEPAPVRQRFVVQSVGRSIAHELGHYLLGSKAHAAAGLMRERFPVSDLLDPGTARFRLLPSEVRLLAVAAQQRRDGPPS